MACCCKGASCSNRISVSCLGRCDLPKHKCLAKDETKPGPVPKHMGWLYTARDAPDHQLRCGWKPGHISCPVLKKIERHNGCGKYSDCSGPVCQYPSHNPCCNKCSAPTCPSTPTRCSTPICPVAPTCCKNPCTPYIRIIRHAGQYTICTKPSNISNAPSGPYPLKYVLDMDDGPPPENAKYSVEAKFNDYHFDYTSSESSFVLDFSPPESKCYKPCPKRSFICMPCKSDNQWFC